MPELPPQICTYILADKSCYAHGADEIYGEYTDLQEPYGIDESWLDVTASASIKGV